MVVWRSLDGAPLVRWAARTPGPATNVRRLSVSHLPWQALSEDSI